MKPVEYNWKLMKHLAFQIEKTHRRERPQQLVAQVGEKVISPKGKKTGKKIREIQRYDEYN